MRVLVACERSGVVREAFRQRGHDAWSCDLEPAQDGSLFHYQRDARAVIRDGWDLMIAHPECRYLCNSGVLRLYVGGKKVNGKDPKRWVHMECAAEFYSYLASAPIDRICIENSVMHGYAKVLTADSVRGWSTQIIQPNQFGDDASKATRIRLKNLPPLTKTKAVDPKYGCSCGTKFDLNLGSYGCPNCLGEGQVRFVWGNQTPSGQNKLGPSPTRSAERAKTYSGIAAAMVEQWGTITS
jgi:hypothetical protein